jgi:hypothetical protein
VWWLFFLPGVRNIEEIVRSKASPIRATAKGGSLARYFVDFALAYEANYKTGNGALG